MTTGPTRRLRDGKAGLRAFVFRATLFAVVPIAIVAALFVVRRHLDAGAYVLPAHVRTLVVGDSHVQWGIRDELLDDARNTATASEAYVFSYFKLRRILDDNPNILRVLIGYSYHNLSSYYEDFVVGEHALSVVPRYVGLMPARELGRMLFVNPRLITAPVRYLGQPRRHPYIGGEPEAFGDVGGPNRGLIETRLRTQYFQEGRLREFSALNIEFLGRIVDLARERGIQLVALNTPLYEAYRSGVPTEYILKYGRLADELSLRVVDSGDLPLDTSHFLPDGDHLSDEGARLATAYLQETLGS